MLTHADGSGWLTDKREAILEVEEAVVASTEGLLRYLLVHFVPPAPPAFTLTLQSCLTLEVELGLDGAAVSFNK